MIGREGVGKTNLVEGLAVNIVRGNAPKNLLNKIIYSLDINSLVAGTKYRGMFEERIQSILEELAENENAILKEKIKGSLSLHYPKFLNKSVQHCVSHEKKLCTTTD